MRLTVARAPRQSFKAGFADHTMDFVNVFADE